MLQPVGNVVWIDPEPPEEYHKYKGYEKVGLIVPDAFAHGPEDRPVWGKVIAYGPECKETLKVKVGSRVVFGKYAPARVRWQEKEYMLVRDEDILAVDE